MDVMFLLTPAKKGRKGQAEFQTETTFQKALSLFKRKTRKKKKINRKD